MSRDEHWKRLLTAAPALHGALLYSLALVLDGPASSDVLLCIADAIAEAAAEYRQLGTVLRVTAQLEDLAEVFRNEAPKRAREPRHV